MSPSSAETVATRLIILSQKPSNDGVVLGKIEVEKLVEELKKLPAEQQKDVRDAIALRSWSGGSLTFEPGAATLFMLLTAPMNAKA